MCKDDAENFTVSIAKKLNKPNFINSANLTANVCKAFSLIKLITKNLDDDEQHYFMASSIEEKKRFHDLVSIFITLPLSCNYNYPAQYHNEVYAKVFTFQYQHIAKFIFRHAQQVADVAMIYNIVKK
ncbi:hypothetical protein LUA82_04345 [Neoehrlichia mikurensis]|nr:hypothetical protein [Neoehrlichia mikurensis]UTO55379.1 hypothetical protein LUA82_04345 [Neoehrlichia mikurensis]